MTRLFVVLSMLSFMNMVLMPTLSMGQLFVGNSKRNSLRMVTSRTMYKSDWLPIPESMMKIATMHDTINEAPYWNIDVTLSRNTSSVAMAGFIAFQAVMLDQEIPTLMSKHRWNSKWHGEEPEDLCKFSDDFKTEDGYRSVSTGTSQIQFQEWRFDEFSDSEQCDSEQMELHFNAKQRVHKTGLWMHIVHLCVTEGDYDQSDLQMQGHQKAVNPLGYLGGDMVMVLPFLMASLAFYLIVGTYWKLQMPFADDVTLDWVQKPISIGMFIGFIEALWRFEHFFTINLYGFEHLSTIRMVFQASMQIVVSLSVITLMSGYCSGAGLLEPGFARVTKVLLAVYFVVHSVIYAHAEYLESEVASNGVFGSWDKIVDLMYHSHILMGAQLMMVVNAVYDFLKTFHALKMEGEYFNVRGFAVIGGVIYINMILKEAAGGRYEYSRDPTLWFTWYLMKDGFLRIIYCVAWTALVYIYRPIAQADDWEGAEWDDAYQTDGSADENVAEEEEAQDMNDAESKDDSSRSTFLSRIKADFPAIGQRLWGMGS